MPCEEESSRAVKRKEFVYEMVNIAKVVKKDVPYGEESLGDAIVEPDSSNGINHIDGSI